MRLTIALTLVLWGRSCAVGGNGPAPHRDFAREVEECAQNSSSFKRVPFSMSARKLEYSPIFESSGQEEAGSALAEKAETSKLDGAAADRAIKREALSLKEKVETSKLASAAADRALKDKVETSKLASAAADRALKEKVETSNLASAAANRALKDKVETNKLASAAADRALKEKTDTSNLASAAANRRNALAVGMMATAGFVAGSVIVSKVGFSFGYFASGIHEIARVFGSFFKMLEENSLLSIIFSPIRRKKTLAVEGGGEGSDALSDSGSPSPSVFKMPSATTARPKAVPKRFFWI